MHPTKISNTFPSGGCGKSQFLRIHIDKQRDNIRQHLHFLRGLNHLAYILTKNITVSPPTGRSFCRWWPHLFWWLFSIFMGQLWWTSTPGHVRLRKQSLLFVILLWGKKLRLFELWHKQTGLQKMNKYFDYTVYHKKESVAIVYTGSGNTEKAYFIVG